MFYTEAQAPTYGPASHSLTNVVSELHSFFGCSDLIDKLIHHERWVFRSVRGEWKSLERLEIFFLRLRASTVVFICGERISYKHFALQPHHSSAGTRLNSAQVVSALDSQLCCVFIRRHDEDWKSCRTGRPPLWQRAMWFLLKSWHDLQHHLNRMKGSLGKHWWSCELT